MVIIDLIIGCLIGVVLGLIPSFHINLVAYIFLAIGAFSLFGNHFFLFLSIPFAQLITNIIPTTVFGVPNESNILQLFPAQKMFKEGLAKKAILLSIIGSFFGMLFSIILLPLLYLLFSILFNFHLLISVVIIFILALFVLSEKTLKSKLAVISIIFIVGTLGLFTLKFNYFFKEPLFICIAGLFGVPFLFYSVLEKEKRVPQRDVVVFVGKVDVINSFLGSFVSLFLILIPSFSSSQGSLIISKIKRKLSSENYLVIFSSISMSALIFSLFLCIYFFKPRLGYFAILLGENIIPKHISFVMFCAVIFLSVVFSCLLVLLIYKKVVDIFTSFNSQLMGIIILILITIMVFCIGGIFGLLLFVLSALIGFLPSLFNVNRLVLMAYIMIPTLLFYL